MRLYLVRHGEAEGSEGRAVGQLDLPLSDLGARNMEALAASWQGASPVRLFASDLRRATDSARVLARRFGVEPVLDARLREVSFGDWEGRSWDEVYESDRQRYDAWAERWWDLAPPGGESFANVAERAFSWFRDLQDGADVVAVAHGGSIRALLVELLAIPRERAFDLQLSPARVSAVEVRDGGCELLFLDQTGSDRVARRLNLLRTREEDAMDLDVRHDEKAGKYYALIDGHEAVCEYGKAGEGTLNFWHTYVPPQLRGKGIADELVRAALDDVMEKGLKVIPSCWFVRVYIDRHQKYKEAVA